jgi:hypothetical protein
VGRPGWVCRCSDGVQAGCACSQGAPYNPLSTHLTMKILLSNDDGYQAPGIVALYEALTSIADVEVVAPEQNNSAKSNALTLHSPLYGTVPPMAFVL